MHEEPAAGGGTPQGALERSLVRLAIGSHQALVDRHNALVSSLSGEYDQQVQIAASGAASSGWGFTDTPVSWEHPFIYAPLQRNQPFLTPHVSHHFEFTSTLSALVLAHVHVLSWNQNDQGWFIGAKVRVAVCAPDVTTPVAYQAVVHLTFQGFAAPTDEENT